MRSSLDKLLNITPYTEAEQEQFCAAGAVRVDGVIVTDIKTKFDANVEHVIRVGKHQWIYKPKKTAGEQPQPEPELVDINPTANAGEGEWVPKLVEDYDAKGYS